MKKQTQINNVAIFQVNNHSNAAITYRSVSENEPVFSFVKKMVEENYDLKKVVSVEVLTKGGGINTSTYAVTCVKGKLCVNHHSRQADKEKITLANRILTHSFLKGAKVVEPVRTLKDEIFVETDKGIYTASKFVNGNYYIGSLEEIGYATEGIAGLHSALSSLPLELLEKVRKKFILQTIPYGNDLVEVLKAKAPKDEVVRGKISEYASLIDSAISQTVVQNNSKPKQVIHGDLNPHNFLFEGKILNAIIDLNEIRVAPLLEDIAYAVHRLGRQIVVAKGAKTNEEFNAILRETKEIFYQRYNLKNSLSLEEMTAIPSLIKQSMLRKFIDLTDEQYAMDVLLWRQELTKYAAGLVEADYFANEA